MSEEKKIDGCSRSSGVGFRLEWRLAPHLDWDAPPMKLMSRLIEREMGSTIMNGWLPGPYSPHRGCRRV